MRLHFVPRDVSREYQLSVPAGSFANYPYLLDLKPIGQRSMQVNSHCTDFGQFYVPPSNRIGFELRKDKRAVLPLLFKSGESKTALGSKLESFVQAFKSILQYLRLHILEFQYVLFGKGKRVLLLVIIGVRRISRNDVFSHEVTSINPTLARRYPVPAFSEGVIINTPALFHPKGIFGMNNSSQKMPRQHSRFLVQVWIKSVRVCQTQHSHILTYLTYLLESLFNIDCRFLLSRCPLYIPALIDAIERGTYGAEFKISLSKAITKPPHRNNVFRMTRIYL